MPGFHYRDGTAVRTAKDFWYRDATAARKAVAAWYNDGVANRKFWPGVVVAITARNPYAQFTPPSQLSGSCSITFSSAGTYSGSVSPSGAGAGSYGNWLTGAASNLYSVRWTPTSGTPDSGNANTWLNLGSDRSFSIAGAPTTSKYAAGLVEIRLDSSGAVVASANMSLTLERVV